MEFSLIHSTVVCLLIGPPGGIMVTPSFYMNNRENIMLLVGNKLNEQRMFPPSFHFDFLFYDKHTSIFFSFLYKGNSVEQIGFFLFYTKSLLAGCYKICFVNYKYYAVLTFIHLVESARR